MLQFQKFCVFLQRCFATIYCYINLLCEEQLHIAAVLSCETVRSLKMIKNPILCNKTESAIYW